MVKSTTSRRHTFMPHSRATQTSPLLRSAMLANSFIRMVVEGRSQNVIDSMTMSGSSSRVKLVVLCQPTGSEKGANMIMVGCDYHPSFQHIAFVDTETGEVKEQRLRGRRSSTVLWRARVNGCVSGWRPADTHAGSNDCSRSCSSIRNVSNPIASWPP